MKLFFVISLLSIITSLHAQQPAAADSATLIRQNQLTDQYVVSQNLIELQKMYADDFVFSHGSGRVDNKSSWLKSVERGGFLKREHDSAKVELHGLVGIIRGKLQVQKNTKTGVNKYYLYYVRVFSKRTGQWQLISHITTSEFH